MAIYSTEIRIDTLNSEKFSKALFSLIEKGEENITVDMKNTAYISSMAFRVFLNAIKKIEARNLSKLKVINVSPTIRKLFEATGFTEVMDIE